MTKQISTKQVDVIVPIYNAIDYVKLCVKSVLSKDAGVPFKLILINDASPDPEVSKYLKSIHDSRVVVLENEENLGFVGTCNKGILYSKNDVVLLNSDTEVTTGWLSRMVKCAYSKPNVATVSPFTNAGAGILNVPDYYKNNSIPENYDLDSWDAVINEISLEKYPKTYTNVGYCFYMSRRVISKIGILDHDTFGKGNGEESDFCLRARRNGYLNLICDNLLIQHEGSSVSFKEQPQISDSKKALVEKNTKILNERYPEFQPWLDDFLKNDPLLDIHTNIWFASTFFSKKKRIAHIVNQEIDADFGGIEIYLRQIANNVDEFDHYAISIQKNYVQITKLLKDHFTKLYIPLSQNLDMFKLHNSRLEKNFEKVLQLLNPNLVHFHGVLNKPVSILDIPKKLNISSIITIHDFSLFFPAYFQFRVQENLSVWDSIVKLVAPADSTYFEKRKVAVLKAFSSLDRIIANSEYTHELLRRSLPEVLIHKVELLENAIETINIKPPSKTNTLRIAWLGTFTKLKGSHEFIDLVKSDTVDEFEWHVYGALDKSDENACKDLYKLATDEKVILHGKYNQEELSSILSSVDVILMPSQVSETFSYCLSEALSAGIHVIATNEGAIGHRLTKYKVGDIVDRSNYVKETIDLLKKYNTDKTLLNIKKQSAKKVKLLSITEHMDMLEKVYSRTVSAVKIYTGAEKHRINTLRINSINYTNNSRFISTSFKSKLFYSLYAALKGSPFFGFTKYIYHKLRR